MKKLKNGKFNHLMRIMNRCHVCFCNTAVAMETKAQKSRPVQGSLAQTAVLSCLFSTTNSTSTSHLRVKWTKVEGRKLVLVVQNGVVIETGEGYLGRVSVPWAPSDEQTGDASLTIQQLRASDQGAYRCEVTQDGSEGTQATVPLDVSGECS